ncbi:MAG: DNA-protecting protein DprA [Deltaproteobacteria bacterium]|jgi:DNA processing protein|nr:DNA-protecting protein DprA [Deltaproteobacteria bacterium]MBT4089845.1 DNA-protecting protein DprA [Deltaproteobacteria bacterium]MBT4266300.1 DNA-protecting protein DprA [Deltaproteobacteria bacterium]MBT4640010.1 DNA-protecting protein DprA [Deltaproteobacteria bacterium]MBT6503103.1 DNA-protecting protein DprA [Deltaproteobacteria bacterium]
MIESKTTKGLLALWLIPGLGPRRIETLLQQLGSLDAIFSTSAAELARITGLKPDIVKSISEGLNSKALHQELSFIEKYQLQVLDYTQATYPNLLREIYNAPPILYTRGDIDFNAGLPLAFVGSRKASFAGKSICQRLIRRLSELRPDTIIVSGLALGIDSAAHKAALENGLKTIAVLAGGLSSIYPAQNRALSDKIIENGALVTEFPATTRPTARNFPLRNRIISGLSKGVTIVEAGERSGASITAGYALEQNRELFALPGPADSKFSLGSNRMIQKGQAKLVIQPEDILEETVTDFYHSQQQTSSDGLEVKNTVQLTIQEEKIIEALKKGALHQNSLTNITDIPVHQLLGILTELELKGLIISKPGSLYQSVEA